MQSMGIPLNFVVGVTDVPNPDSEGKWDEEVEVPALYINGELVYSAPPGTYFDKWGDGGPTAADAIIELIKEKLQ